MATKADLFQTLIDQGYEPEEGETEHDHSRKELEHLIGRYEEPAKPSSACSNHPDRDAVWTSDGVAASVIHYCQECVDRHL